MLFQDPCSNSLFSYRLGFLEPLETLDPGSKFPSTKGWRASEHTSLPKGVGRDHLFRGGEDSAFTSITSISPSGESALRRHTRPLDLLTSDSDLTFPFLLTHAE